MTLAIPVGEQRGSRVPVGVDESWRDGAITCVDDLSRGTAGQIPKRGDAFSVDADIDSLDTLRRACAVVDSAARDHDVEFGPARTAATADKQYREERFHRWHSLCRY